MCGVPCSVRRTTAPPATGVGVAALAGAGSRPATTTPARVNNPPNVHLRLRYRVMVPPTPGVVAHRYWSAAFRHHDSLAPRGGTSLGDERGRLRSAQLSGRGGHR